MRIEYVEPLSRAFGRMKTALFKPFNLNKWFAVGFTAFLAGLMDGPGKGSGDGDGHRGGVDFGDILEFPENAWEWLLDHPIGFFAIAFAALFIIFLTVLLTWLSSRGKFMFLDNVVHDRALVKKPWREFETQAHSLFIWRLLFGLVCFAVIIAFLVMVFIVSAKIYYAQEVVPIAFLLMMGLLFLVLIIAISYISCYLDSFVTPIMYKERITATRAWGRFMEIFNRHPFHFIGYGVFTFFLVVFGVIGFIIAGALACCIGLLLVILPYIGTVTTLPLWYTMRAFSLEYLAQFGDEFQLFPPPAPVETSEPAESPAK